MDANGGAAESLVGQGMSILDLLKRSGVAAPAATAPVPAVSGAAPTAIDTIS